MSEPVGPQRLAGPPSKPGKPAGDHGAGVFVALATVAVVAIGAWFALPGFQAIIERSAANRPATVREATAPPASKPPAASRPVRRAPAAATATPERKRGLARLKPVQYALLKVDSDPWALLYVDGVKIGLTPISNHRLSLGTHRLRVEQKGYQAVTETIVVKSTGPVTRRYNLRRRPAR